MDTSLHLEMFGEYERMAEDVRSIQQRMAEIRATADSGDGLISATVGGAGELIELWLDPRIYRAPNSGALAQAITDTIHRAVELSQEEGFAIAAKFLPSGATAETADLRFDPFLHALDRQVAGGERQ
ncbi:YbaB/EbfC family nucleoid-associated protein [Micromonospora sonneratiae]|uniref:YbaB/EbfC family nucleoid-associated protein n=1 Tax=Micromonospora sonneratiae TaxID=1184706 RepID=A0ABW3YNA2_9ACTN